MTCTVSVTTLLWFKALEGLTSHLETFILFCISKYEGVCGWGPGVVRATALVVFQWLWYYAGYDQRDPSGSPWMRTAFPFEDLAFAVSLRLWVWVFYYVFIPGKTEKPIHVFLLHQKNCKTLWRVLDPCNFTIVWLYNWKLSRLLWRVVAYPGCTLDHFRQLWRSAFTLLYLFFLAWDDFSSSNQKQ